MRIKIEVENPYAELYIRMVLRRKGLSIGEFARCVNLSRALVSLVITGKRTANKRFIGGLAVLLGKSQEETGRLLGSEQELKEIVLDQISKVIYPIIKDLDNIFCAAIRDDNLESMRAIPRIFDHLIEVEKLLSKK